MESHIGILNGLAEGLGPSPKQLLIYSSFYKLCLKRMENFVMVDVKAPEPKKKGLFSAPRERVFGSAAMRLIFGDMQKDLHDGVQKTIGDYQIFRTFDWMLTDEMRETTGKWISDVHIP